MSTVKAANLQNTGSGAPAFKNSSGTEIGHLCKAFVSWDGTNATIDASFNVSALTDNGTGDYTLSFATNFANTNYSIAGICGGKSNETNDRNMGLDTVSVGSVRVKVRNADTDTLKDVAKNCLVFFAV